MADTNRIALVTGTNKGIGLKIARQLAQARVFVIIGARDPARAKAALEDLSSQGLAAESVSIDLNDHASIVAAAETIRAEHVGWTFSSITRVSSMQRTVRRPRPHPKPSAESWTRISSAPWR